MGEILTDDEHERLNQFQGKKTRQGVKETFAEALAALRRDHANHPQALKEIAAYDTIGVDQRYSQFIELYNNDRDAIYTDPVTGEKINVRKWLIENGPKE